MKIQTIAGGVLSLALVSAVLAGGAAAQQPVAKSDYYIVNFNDKGAQFMDAGGLQQKGTDAVYWTVVVMAGSQDHAYSMWLNHLDCAGRRSRVMMANFFDADGGQLRSVAGPTDWREIAPGSSGETFIAIACKGSRPTDSSHVGDIAPAALYGAFQKTIQTAAKK